MMAGVAAAVAIQLPKTINGMFGTELWEFPGLYAFFATAPFNRSTTSASASFARRTRRSWWSLGPKPWRGPGVE
jgi:hypothetical protein